MTTKSRSALGKGMGALLSSSVTPQSEINGSKNIAPIGPNGGALLIPLHKIKGNTEQPRKIFKDKDLFELSASIKEIGVIQPISVQENGDGTFMIIAGERRFRASKLAGLDSIPAIIKRASRKEVLVMAIVENVQRSDLNCVEEALAYYQLMNEFNLTQEEVSKKVGKDRSSVANFLRILKLPREVVGLLQKEELSLGHAKVLAAVKDDERIKRMARTAVDEKMSVRDLEKLIKAKSKKIKSEPNKFFNEKIDALRQKLENKTGYHFDVKAKNNGSGQIAIKFSNEAEFNDIFEFLTKK